MIDKLESIQERFHYLEERLSDPELISDMKAYKKTNKEYSSLKEIVSVYKSYTSVIEGIESTEEILKETSDPEMKEMAQEELSGLQQEKEDHEEKLKVLLIPKDPDDDNDVIVEIRSGAGGDEASIFAGDLHRMYTKFIDTKNWKTEILDINEGTSGGYNKITFEVKGENVYGVMKFESGAHRVQRVPRTESQGRVHTSAATVAVIPMVEEEDINIRKDELRTDTFRASGAGGQHVNKTESGVRFTHIPTGIVAESTDSRSQHKNREIALQRLYLKIKETRRLEQENKDAEQRKSLVGSGDRSDKIRTYNYPQNRVTDHRINLTLYSLDKIIDGQINDIIEALILAENASKMAMDS